MSKLLLFVYQVCEKCQENRPEANINLLSISSWFDLKLQGWIKMT